MNEPTHLDLFSGIGGFSLGFESAGFRTVGFSEIDTYACAVLKKHWPNVVNYGDVRTIPTESLRGQIDVVTGGFPCQPFSIAGRRRGKADDRHLWPAMLRVIEEVRPRWILGENVVGIANMVLSQCLDELVARGYIAEAFDIPACSVGLPTMERHIWIIASRSDVRLEGIGELEFPRRQDAFMQRGQIHAGAQRWAELAQSGEPKLRRGRKGIPGYVDRIRCLGNAIDPQTAFVFAKAIQTAEEAISQTKGSKDSFLT